MGLSNAIALQCPYFLNGKTFLGALWFQTKLAWSHVWKELTEKGQFAYMVNF